MRKLPLKAALAAAGVLCAPIPAGAAECPAMDPVPAAARCPAVDRPAPLRPPGLRVFLDRRTGRLRAPTPEEARALFEKGPRSVQHLVPLEIVTHPGGMRAVDLQGAFSQSVVVRRNRDGTFSSICRPSGSVPEEK
jgi:hypothetical protein